MRTPVCPSVKTYPRRAFVPGLANYFHTTVHLFQYFFIPIKYFNTTVPGPLFSVANDCRDKNTYYPQSQSMAAGKGSNKLQQLQATCQALRDEVTALYEHRDRGLPDERRHWRVLLLLSAMKAGLRATFVEAETRRALVQEQKNVAETHQLQLQNLLYEKDHLVREMRRCQGFGTKEMDKIEFSDGCVPIQVDDAVHRQHLARLTFELHARKRYAKKPKTKKPTFFWIG